MELFYVRNNDSDMLIADHGDHRHYVTVGSGVNPADEYEAMVYLDENAETLGHNSHEWEETDKTLDELTNGGEAEILASTEENKMGIKFEGVESIQTVSNVLRFRLSEGVSVVVMPSERGENEFHFVMMIEGDGPICMEYMLGQRMRTRLDGSLASALTFKMEAERYILHEAGFCLASILERVECAKGTMSHAD